VHPDVMPHPRGGGVASTAFSGALDLGNITTARGTEMVLPIWVRLFGVLQKPIYNFKIVR
jgi:8-hydroxy-5-deazaflavin:NADPH oxidoreductase